MLFKMSVEIQWLVLISLGKIRALRERHGGTDLRKNLLVTGVLLKARDIYLKEISETSTTRLRSNLWNRSECMSSVSKRDRSSLS